VRAAVNPPQQEQPQQEAQSGQWLTHRSGSNHNGRPGQGGGQPTAAGATATGGPVQGASQETQGGGQPTAARATATGGPVQGAIPTTGTGTNVAGVQGPGANAPASMPPGTALIF
jgi:hypothetical protein